MLLNLCFYIDSWTIAFSMVFLSVMSSCLRLNRAVPNEKEMSCQFPLFDICELYCKLENVKLYLWTIWYFRNPCQSESYQVFISLYISSLSFSLLTSELLESIIDRDLVVLATFPLLGMTTTPKRHLPFCHRKQSLCKIISILHTI